MFEIKKQIGPRHAILRDVYEENLRILGKGREAPRWRFPYYIKSSFMFIPFLVLMILSQADHIGSNTSLSKAKPITGSTGGQENGNAAEYLSLTDEGGIPLKSVFGLGVKTIVIDPGHGGSDPGTEGKLGLKEKDVTLEIARMLKARLEKHGKFNVLLTRESDVTLPLTARADFANMNRADLFVSIHVNYVPARPINILETYYFGPSKDDESLRLATVENADSHYRMGEFKEMIEKIGDTLKLQESQKLASFIQDSLFLNISERNKTVLDYGIKRAPFVVLLGAEMPGVLAEVSCMSNREEEMKLHTKGHRESIALYLESGILNYLSKGEAVYEARSVGR